MPSRKYTCPRCHLAFVSRKSPRNIRCPACGATLPPPEDWKERHTLTVFGWLMRAGVGTLAVLASPVLLLTNALSASGAADEGGGKTTAAERREIGLGIVVLLFIGFVAACVTFMVRAMKEEPDPEPVVQKMKSGQQPAPQPAPPPPQTAEAPQQQTGVPVIDQLHAEKAPDLTLVLEQVQNRYDLPGTGTVKLPKLEAVKVWTLASPAVQIEGDRQQTYDEIVNRFLLYQSGKLTAAEAQKALADFHQLGLEAVPALIRGVNLAVTQTDNTAPIIARKLRLLLDGTDDRSLLAYAFENIGKDVINPAPFKFQLLTALHTYLEQRLAVSKEQLKQNLSQLVAGLGHANPAVRAVAANALGNLGPDARTAVPHLAQLLSDPNGNVRGKAARALVEAGPEAVPSLVAALKDNEARPYAAAALAEVRPVPQDAMGALIDNLKEPEPERRAAAQAALVSIGAPAVTPLIETLKDKERRNGAALTLGRIGKPAEPALPDLMQGLKDPDATFRISSHQALVHMGPSAVPQLIQGLKDPNERVWYSCVLALGKIGPAAKSAIPALVDAMKGDNKSLRILALNALARIEPDHRAIGARLDEIVPILTESLKNDEPAIRSWACVCLGRLGRAAKPATAGLAATLKDRDISIRVQAALALGQISPEAKEAAPGLVSALVDAPPPLRNAIVTSLANLGTAVTADLISALKHPQDAVRSGAVDTLVRIGPPALPALLPALRDPDANVCRLATTILQRMGPAAREATPALLTNLKDPDRQVRFATVEAIRAIRPITPETLQALWATAQDPSGAVADAVRQTLTTWKLDRSSVATLQSVLEDKDVERRGLAITLLGNIGAEAKAAVPALLALLQDKEPRTRWHAAQALGLIAPNDSAVLAALLERLQDANVEVAATVPSALARAGAAAVPGLTPLLKAKDAVASTRAAAVLATMGPAARPAVPALVEACGHTDARVRRQAVRALHALEPAAPTVLSALIDRLKDADPHVRSEAQTSLTHVAPAAMPLLLAALRSKEVLVRCGAIEIIKNAAMEGTANEKLLRSLGELVAALQDADKQVRDDAASALAEIDPELRTAVPALVALVNAGTSNNSVKGQTDLRYVTEGEIVAASTSATGARLKAVLEELRRRRGNRILAALAYATIHTDPEARQLAHTFIVQYLAQKPKADDEQQAAARLKLYKRLHDDGKKSTAQQRYRELIRDLPHTRAAEEARRLLAGKT